MSRSGERKLRIALIDEILNDKFYKNLQKVRKNKEDEPLAQYLWQQYDQEHESMSLRDFLWNIERYWNKVAEGYTQEDVYWVIDYLDSNGYDEYDENAKPITGLNFEELFVKAMSGLMSMNGGSLETAMDDAGIYDEKERKIIKSWMNWDEEDEEEGN